VDRRAGRRGRAQRLLANARRALRRPGPAAAGRVEGDDGTVLDHTVAQGNPADAPQLVPAVERVIARTGRRPRTVTADRGYGETNVEDGLHQPGMRTVVIPRKGKPGRGRRAEERFGACEVADRQRGRISSLKRGYGWDRTRLDGTEGARI
jgi:IS5 family transposase